MKGHGHSEEEIAGELESIKNGEVWAGFEDVHRKNKGNEKRASKDNIGSIFRRTTIKMKSGIKHKT